MSRRQRRHEVVCVTCPLPGSTVCFSLKGNVACKNTNNYGNQHKKINELTKFGDKTLCVLFKMKRPEKGGLMEIGIGGMDGIPREIMTMAKAVAAFIKVAPHGQTGKSGQ